jgi:hypothetical protein
LEILYSERKNKILISFFFPLDKIICMFHTTSATSVVNSVPVKKKEENSKVSTKVKKEENSPKIKVEKKPEEKKNKKTLHEKLFGDIHELETKRDSSRKDHSDVFNSFADSPMESIGKDIEN